MGEHLAYEDPVGNCMAYLSRHGRNTGTAIREAHQLPVSRAAAREYGVTDKQLLWLDENLN